MRKFGMMNYTWFLVENGYIYIRFNLNKYKSKNGKNKNPNISDRLIELKKEIEKTYE